MEEVRREIIFSDTKKRLINTKVLCFFVFLVVLFSISIGNIANAANLYFSPSSGVYTIGNTFSVSVFVSSVDQAMNAVSGMVSFPADKLEILSLSKAGSIINLWVQEPSFSNAAGVVNFEGIVLNPGFTGVSGKVITINFKTKAVGNALLTFSSGSVLANDGKGTNILTDLGNANFNLNSAAVSPQVGEATTPSIISDAPLAPVISSPTHPNPEKWYNLNNAKFNWQAHTDATAVRLLYDKNPNSQPKIIYDPPISEKEISGLKDGIYYFHVQLRNKSGWGGISHFKFQIDTQPPKPFKIEVKEGRETTNPQPTLSFETTDEMSGIDHYEIVIDNKEPLKTEKSEYKIPSQDLGKHAIIVKAIDKAGNETLAMTEIEILAIEAPVITDYPKELMPGNILSIKGTAIPEATIIVYLQKDKGEIKKNEIKSGKDGKWVFIEVEPVEKGVYQVWAEAIDSFGGKSKPSEKVSVLVSPPALLKIGKLVIDYLTIIITLIIFFLFIILGFLWFLGMIKRKKKKIKKEVSEAEKALYQAFRVLKEEVEGQVAKLDGKIGLNEREKKIYDELKKALKISEKIIGKEIEDIEKALK